MPRGEVGFRLAVGLGVALWFGAFYAAADLVMKGRGEVRSLLTPLDAWLPFWPGFALAYLGITPFLCLPLVVLRSRVDIQVLALTLMTEIVVAAVVFVTFPTASPPVPAGPHPLLFQLADAINLDRNNLPSLHVALTLTVMMALRGQVGRFGSLVTGAAVLICASTLVTRQHDVASVAAGAVLAWAGQAVVAPLVRRALTGRR